MMFRWLAQRRAVRAAAELTASDLVAAVGPSKAWHVVQQRRRDLPAGDAENDRALTEVLRAIERLTGYSHQPDTATRYLEP